MGSPKNKRKSIIIFTLHAMNFKDRYSFGGRLLAFCKLRSATIPLKGILWNHQRIIISAKIAVLTSIILGPKFMDKRKKYYIVILRIFIQLELVS